MISLKTSFSWKWSSGSLQENGGQRPAGRERIKMAEHYVGLGLGRSEGMDKASGRAMYAGDYREDRKSVV